MDDVELRGLVQRAVDLGNPDVVRAGLDRDDLPLRPTMFASISATTPW
jgi:hypothetical protein